MTSMMDEKSLNNDYILFRPHDSQQKGKNDLFVKSFQKRDYCKKKVCFQV